MYKIEMTKFREKNRKDKRTNFLTDLRKRYDYLLDLIDY